MFEAVRYVCCHYNTHTPLQAQYAHEAASRILRPNLNTQDKGSEKVTWTAQMNALRNANRKPPANSSAPVLIAKTTSVMSKEAKTSTSAPETNVSKKKLAKGSASGSKAKAAEEKTRKTGRARRSVPKPSRKTDGGDSDEPAYSPGTEDASDDEASADDAVSNESDGENDADNDSDHEPVTGKRGAGGDPRSSMASTATRRPRRKMTEHEKVHRVKMNKQKDSIMADIDRLRNGDIGAATL